MSKIMELADIYAKGNLHEDEARAALATEVEQLTRERQAFKDAAEYAVKERDALRVEVERHEASAKHFHDLFHFASEEIDTLRTQLAAAQADAKRVALSDEQIAAIRLRTGYGGGLPRFIELTRAIERAHGIDAAMREGEGT